MLGHRIYCIVLSLIIFTIIGQRVNCFDNCYNDSCIYPPTCNRVNVGKNYLVIQDLPFFEVMAIETADINNVDNICNTASPIDKSTSMIFRTKVYKDGSYVVEKQLLTFISGNNTDIVRTVSTVDNPGCSSCIQNLYTLGSVCSNQVLVVYKCYAYGDCDHLDDAVDNRSAYSKYPYVSDACYESILQVANSQSCLRGSNFTRLPFKLNRKCVTAYNGVPTINADRVPKEDSLILL